MFVSQSADKGGSDQGARHKNRLREFILVRLTTKEVPLRCDRREVRGKRSPIANRTVHSTTTFQRPAVLQVRFVYFWAGPFWRRCREHKYKHLVVAW